MIKIEPKLLRQSLATIIDYGLYLAFFIWAVTTFGVPNPEGSNVYFIKNVFIINIRP